MRASIGLTVEELYERWQKDQKVTYWPEHCTAGGSG